MRETEQAEGVSEGIWPGLITTLENPLPGSNWHVSASHPDACCHIVLRSPVQKMCASKPAVSKANRDTLQPTNTFNLQIHTHTHVSRAGSHTSTDGANKHLMQNMHAYVPNMCTNGHACLSRMSREYAYFPSPTTSSTH